MKILGSDGSYLRSVELDDAEFYYETMADFPGYAPLFTQEKANEIIQFLIEGEHAWNFPLQASSFFVLCLVYCDKDHTPLGLRSLRCTSFNMHIETDTVHPSHRGKGVVRHIRRAWMYVTWEMLKGSVLTWDIRHDEQGKEILLKYNAKEVGKSKGKTGRMLTHRKMTKQEHADYMQTGASSFDKLVTYTLIE